jgi:hypothetical protein
MAQTLKFGNGTWATKKDSILAYSDTNENYKPLPFNYTGAGKGTRVNKEGLIEVVENDRPRIDYTDNTKGALLLEPTRSNLVYPSDIGTPTSGVGVKNYLAPDGTISAFKVQPTSIARRFQVIISGGTYSTNTKLTYSWHRKRVSTPQGAGFEGDLDIKLLINAAQVGDTIQTQSNVSGYDRFSATFNVTNGSLETTLRLYYGNVVGVGNSSIAYWGHQLEEGSYATSYIPTQGTIQTRVQETASGSGNSEVFNDSEGVLFADIAALADDGTFRVIAINGTPTNVNEDRIQIYFRDTANIINFGMESGNSSQFFSQFPLDVKLNNKLALKYSASSCSFWINGFEVGEELNKVMPTGLSRLDFNIQNGNDDFYGKTKEIAYYDEVLTEEELETLTSYRSWLSMVKELNLNVIYNG